MDGISITSEAQLIFYQDIFFGGVTSGGFSTGQGFGSGTLNLFIEPSSTIKKAYLFTYRMGYPPNVPITINGTPFIFDTTDVIMQVSHGSPVVSPIHLYYYDFTDYLNANITSSFNITIPTQNGLSLGWGYYTIYIYIAYENPTLPKVATSLWVNDKNFMGNESYVFTNMNPINNSFPVGLSLFLDRACDNTTDGTIVTLNSNNIGTIGGPDAVNSLWNCSGAKGHFYYQNNTLFGLDDDTPDNLMDNTDALADMSSYVLNNVTNYNLNLLYMNPLNPPAGYNLNNLFINAYSTPCDTFSTTATTNTDTICKGDSVQLTATGGVTYSWFSAFSTFNDSTLANPVATPTQTTTYIVTIKNDSGCVKTEHVKIWVNPAPQPDTILIAPQNCGNSDGSITVGNIANGASPFTYQVTDLATGNLQSQISNSFTNLTAGNYLLNITDANGCQWQSDTLVVLVVNNTQANFITNPQPSFANPAKPVGRAPLSVDFINQSTLANSFEWFIIYQATGDTIFTTNIANFTYEFIVGGTFELCLVAYNTFPICADTLCKTITIDDNLSIIISNLLTPNGDGKNDMWYIANVNQINGCSVLIFNRWGSKLFETSNYNNDWEGTYNGKNLPDGAYFYVIVCEDQTYKGPLTLLRTAK